VAGLRIHAGLSMGIVEGQGGGGHSYTDVRVTRRPGGPGLLSVNADGFHSNSAARGPRLRGCEVGFTGDDLANVTPRMLVLLTRLSDTEVLVIDPDGGRQVCACEDGRATVSTCRHSITSHAPSRLRCSLRATPSHSST
jgi:hypothetical protein